MFLKIRLAVWRIKYGQVKVETWTIIKRLLE